MGNPWNIVAALALTILAAGSAATLGRLSPAAGFAAFWAALTWTTLLVARDVDVWPPAVFFIALGIATFAAGGLIAARWPRPAAGRHASAPADGLAGERVGPWLLVAGALCGLTGIAVLLATSGHEISIANLPAIAADYTDRRYRDPSTEPLGFRLLVIPHYAACILAGHLFQTTRSGRVRMLSFLPFIPAMMVTLVLTTKAAIMYPVIMWGSGFLASAVRERSAGLSPVKLKTLGGALLLAAIVFPTVMAVSQGWRHEFESIGLAFDDWRLALFGSLGAFSIVLRAHLAAPVAPSYGARTLFGPFHFLGLRPRELGIYSTPVLIGDHYLTNVFTAFRALIDDFTVPGALLVLFVIGYLAQSAYQRVRAGAWLAVAPLSAVYALILASHMAFMFGYNSVIGAWTLFTVYLWFTRTRPANLTSSDELLHDVGL